MLSETEVEARAKKRLKADAVRGAVYGRAHPEGMSDVL